MARETIGTAFVRIIADGRAIPDDIRRALRKGEPAMQSAGEDHAEAYHKGFNKEIQGDSDPNSAIIARLQKGIGRFDAQGRLAGHRLGDGIRDELDRAFPNGIGEQIFKDLERDVQEGRLAINKIGLELERNLRVRVARATKTLTVHLEDAGDEGGRRFSRGFMNHVRNAFAEGSREGKIFGNRFGRLFGAGMRNDFLNAVGRALGGLAGGISSIVGGLTGLVGLSGEGASAMNRLGSTFLTVGASATVVAFAIGILAALLSGLTAIITALAGSITFALIGAVGALAGALTVLLGGIGLSIAAVKSLDGALKDALVDALEPFKDGFKELGDLAAKNIFTGIPEELDRLEDNFELLTPLVDRLSKALHNVLLEFIDLGESPTVAKFIKAMTTFLPDATETLGEILRHTIGGMLGLFRSLIPLTERFLDWLDEVTTEFAKFTNSAEGQKALKDFWEEAGDAAASFGKALVSVTGLLFDLFKGVNGGAAAGNEIFDSLTKNVEKLRDFLDTPAGQSALKEWLDDGVELAQTIGDLIVGIGKFIGALDTEETQAALRGLLDLFTDIFSFIADHEQAFLHLGIAIAGVGAALITMNAALTTFRFITTLVIPAFSALRTQIDSTRTSAAGAEQGFSKMGTAAKIAAGVGGIATLGLSMHHAADEGTSFSNVLAGAAGGAGIGAMFGPVGALIGGVAGGGLTALAGAFHDTSDSASDTAAQMAKVAAYQKQKQAIDELRASLDETTGAFTDLTRATILNGLQTGTFDTEINGLTLTGQQMLDIFDKFGVKNREFVSAMQGDASALREVRYVMDLLSGSFDKFNIPVDQQNRAIQKLQDSFHELGIEGVKYHELIGLLEGGVKGLRGDVVQARKDQIAFANATKNVREILHTTQKEMKNWPKRLVTRIDQRGIPEARRDLASLIKQYDDKLDRRQVLTLIEQSGAATTVKDATKLINLLEDELDKRQIVTILKQTGAAETRAEARALAVDLGLLGRQAGENWGSGFENNARSHIDSAANYAYNRFANLRLPAPTIPAPVSSGGGGGGTRTGGAPTASPRVTNFGGITIITPTEDPVAVATETFNRLAAAAYI